MDLTESVDEFEVFNQPSSPKSLLEEMDIQRKPQKSLLELIQNQPEKWGAWEVCSTQASTSFVKRLRLSFHVLRESDLALFPHGNRVLETRFSYRPLEARFSWSKIPRTRHLEIEPLRLDFQVDVKW